MFTYISFLSPITFHTKQVCLALPCVWLGACCMGWLPQLTLVIQAWLFLKFKNLLKALERVHRLTCVQWADWDPKGQFYIPAVSGRNSSFFSLLPLSFLLPVHPLGRKGASIIEMSEAAGEDAGYCSMSKTSQVSEFVFKQQDPAKSEYRFSLSLRWSGEPSTLL